MNLVVVSSNPSNNGETFVTKLRATKTVDLGDILGTKPSTKTYYISTTKQAPVKAELELNLGIFNIVERPYVDENGDLPTDDEGNVVADRDGNPLMLKWLHLK